MLQNVFNSQVIELTSEITDGPCVSFDPERVRLEGIYHDQISAYRAKRAWIEALERCFLLDLSHDFSIAVSSAYDEGRFTLHCDFLTACARYAFWRLTNHQAPEAQYTIETAHIPRGESRLDDFVAAPDLSPLRPEHHDPLVLQGDGHRGNLADTVRSVFERIVKSLSKESEPFDPRDGR